MNDLNTLIVAECEKLIAEESSRSWLSDQIKNLSSGSSFFIAFGMAPKKVGKAPVTLSEELMDAFQSINLEAHQIGWSLDELARLALLLHLPLNGRHGTLKKLLTTSDIREQKLIYKSIQYLQEPKEFEMQVVDGIRTNMIDVFDAIALHNSFPIKHFKEAAWNQMVLKAIFMERPIHCITGLDKNRNADLARIAVDFAHERQSAGRKVTPELWRLVVPFVDEALLPDLIEIVQSGDNLEQEAAVRALSECDLPSAHSWLESQGIQINPKGWKAIGEATFSSK